MYKVLFIVRKGNANFVCLAPNRDSAKRQARIWLGGDSDQYVVEPLTTPGDRIHIALTVAI